MDDVRVVQIVQGFADLVDNISLMLFLQDVALTNQSVQVHIHMLKYEIDVDVVVCFHYSLQLYDIRMGQLPQKHDLSVDPLRIGGVSKSIEIFLEGL